MVTFEPRFASTHSIVPPALDHGALGHQVVRRWWTSFEWWCSARARFLLTTISITPLWNESVV